MHFTLSSWDICTVGITLAIETCGLMSRPDFMKDARPHFTLRHHISVESQGTLLSRSQ